MQGFLALNLFLMVCIEAFISAQSVAELKWQNGVVLPECEENSH